MYRPSCDTADASARWTAAELLSVDSDLSGGETVDPDEHSTEHPQIIRTRTPRDRSVGCCDLIVAEGEVAERGG